MQISESKSNLESALELSRDMYKQMSYINMSIESINKELDTQRHRPDLPVNAIYVTVCNRKIFIINFANLYTVVISFENRQH